MRVLYRTLLLDIPRWQKNEDERDVCLPRLRHHLLASNKETVQVHGGWCVMATVMGEKKTRKSCPVCGTLVEELELAHVGLTKEQLQILKRHRDNNTLGHLIHLVDIFASKMNVDQALQESEQKQAMTKLENMILQVEGGLTELIERVAGPGVGAVGEKITIKDLKSLCPTDEFTAEKASKHGTDIVATVKNNDEEYGNVAVSVKYVAQWEGEYLTQLRKNMKQEHTPFGLLVTKVFPSDALNDKAYAKTAKPGEMLLLVKPEYAAIAYYSFRQVVIAWERANAIIKDEKEKIREHKRIAKAVVEWISGPAFRDTIDDIDTAIKCSTTTSEDLERIRTYLDRNFENIQDEQEDLRKHLRFAKNAMESLKKKLDGKKEEGK